MTILVPFIDLKKRFLNEKKELMPIIEKTLEKGSLVLTDELYEFETMISNYTNSKYAIGLNSGTDALMMALMASGIKKGDEVITSPISFIATAGAIVHVGAKPVFVDVGEDFLIDPALIEKAITNKTKAIMPVHWSGRTANMEEIIKIASRNNLLIIEDSAQSMGAFYKNKHAGTFGVCGAISFHPLKNLNGLGDGGMLLTQSEEIAEKVRNYRNHGLISRDHVEEFGINSRLDIIHSEVLKYRLTKLNWVIEQRLKNINYYKKNINPNILTIPNENKGENSSHVIFLVRSKQRDELKEFLFNFGIESLVYYGKPLHLQPASLSLGYKKGDFKNAETLANEVLALPHHQYLKRKELKYVCEIINKFNEDK
jgi:dTDP-4-amino-4,6-dideoxygalactose transaminase